MPDRVDVHGQAKPLLRGRIHAAALLAAIPAGIILVARASGAPARTAAVVYGLSLIALFGASSAYHRLGKTERTTAWLRRLDHSTIFILIAGSYTPVCLVALSGWTGAILLVVLWTAAIIGVVLKLFRFDTSHRVGFTLYLTMGWAAVIAMPSLVSVVPVQTLLFLVAGGVVYTLGAIGLATRFPNPFPRVFGYHEVWHVLVVVAAAFHYAAISNVVTLGP
jgi:hemolysin III